MTTDLTREINAINDELEYQRAQLKPVEANYYSFSGDDGRRNAGLIVLLDTTGRAMQAEVHFYSRLPLQTQNAVLRQSQALLASRYRGGGTVTLLYVFEGGQQQQTIEVTHNATEAPLIQSSFRLWPVVAAVVALLVLLPAFVWALTVMMRGGQGRTATASPAATIAINVAAAGVAITSTEAIDPTAQQIRTNDLPGSRNADPSIGMGMQVRIRPELKSFVLSEPGPDQGDVKGYLQNGETATIIGGPVWLEGDSDTIVWWYVELPNGVRGWTPANTSTLRLLEPVP